VFGQIREIDRTHEISQATMELLPNVNEKDSREELWDFIFSKIYSDSDVWVVTTEGQIIKGEATKQGDKVQERDLLISNPDRYVIDDSGELIPVSGDSMTYAYIHNQIISHILFEEDLNIGDQDVADKHGEGRDRDERDSPLRQMVERAKAEQELVENEERLESIELDSQTSDED